MASTTPFFQLENNYYLANDTAGGPWSRDACHAGPPAAALAREFETLTQKQLVRMTFNLQRPIPMAGFSISAQITKEGRRTAYARAEINDRNNKVCATGEALFHLPIKINAFSKVRPEQMSFEPVKNFLRDPDVNISANKKRLCLPKGNFAGAVDVVAPSHLAISREEGALPGDSTEIWMRTPPLLESETMSGFQKVCPLADCMNGVSAHLDIAEYTFMNTDLIITLHRSPDVNTEWLGMQAQTNCYDNALGACNATLYDEYGAIGHATQNLLLQDRN